jgi:hypothetical protein
MAASPIDYTIAYYGLLRPDADIVRAARESRTPYNDLAAAVAEKRASAQRLLAARAEYLKQVRAEYDSLQGVIEANHGYSDIRRGVTESDILTLAEELASS